ncbi:MAG: glycosyltransferase [Acidimicrobiia bacterium]|nr:glycosyltransferase [Acidimicrobiia bacterium]
MLSTADIGLAPDPRNPLNNVSSMNKIVEYMALGTPVVSFDLLESRRTAADAARYAPDGDHRAFAEAIAALVDDPDDRARRAEFGREQRRDPSVVGRVREGVARGVRTVARGAGTNRIGMSDDRTEDGFATWANDSRRTGFRRAVPGRSSPSGATKRSPPSSASSWPHSSVPRPSGPSQWRWSTSCSCNCWFDRG